ncbi:ATP-binding protein [Limosilactobacillus mucosae]|uniref:ATP-binding protein n=1 Tax=Limosilactobacillus mucosae TaxID=97478 RepID=UPI0015D54D52|nr:ATP-binding protein [Limosilactobacillus mucosae]QLI94510.1 ATP-binding protein [Limosilactobacillus mucosae]
MLSVKDSAKEGVRSLKKIFDKEGWNLPDVDLTDKQAMADYLKKKAEPLHDEWRKENARHNFNRVYRKSLWTGNQPVKFTFDDWKVDKQADKKQAAEIGNRAWTLAKMIANGQNMNVYLAGNPGTGKTSLALAMVDKIRNESGKTALFVSTDALAELYSRRFDDKTVQNRLYGLIDLMQGNRQLKIEPVDVLVLDDFGTEGGMRTDTKSQVRVDMQKGLFSVADARFGKFTTIVTTNNKTSELQEMYNEKLLSRLITRNPEHRLTFNGMVDVRASMI